MKILYQLKAIDEETDETIGKVEAYSLEHLEEQFRKVENQVKKYITPDEPEQEEVQMDNPDQRPIADEGDNLYNPFSE